MFAEPFGVAAGLAMFFFSQRGLRDQGTEPGIVGFIGKLGQLLFGDRQVVAQRAELLAHAAKLALDLGTGHFVSLRRGFGVSIQVRFGHPGSVRRICLVVIVLSQLAIACGGGSGSAACVELREAEDQQSGLHVLSDEGLVYLTDPPTSGPHASGDSPTGVLDSPLLAPVQVRILEGAGVVVQYDARVSSTDIDALNAIAGAVVVVAPAADELPAPIVATAWTWKLTCSDADVERIQSFAEERRVDSPGFD